MPSLLQNFTCSISFSDYKRLEDYCNGEEAKTGYRLTKREFVREAVREHLDRVKA